MPLGKFDQTVFWLLLKSNVALARSASLSVARNAFAAATTLGVAAAPGDGCVARCMNPAATSTPKGRMSESSDLFTRATLSPLVRGSEMKRLWRRKGEACRHTNGGPAYSQRNTRADA